MIDVKQAIQIARAGAADMLNQAPSSPEEIERDSYKDRDVWSITLSLPRDCDATGAYRQACCRPVAVQAFSDRCGNRRACCHEVA